MSSSYGHHLYDAITLHLYYSTGPCLYNLAVQLNGVRLSRCRHACRTLENDPVHAKNCLITPGIVHHCIAYINERLLYAPLSFIKTWRMI